MLQADKQNDVTGAFKRSSSVFRDFITADGPFLPEADRYHLYIAYAVLFCCVLLITNLVVSLGF